MENQRFDKLVIIKDLGNIRSVSGKSYHKKFLCRCDCGNVVEVFESNLKDPHRKSITCGLCEDAYTRKYVGQRFGMLTVVEALDFVSHRDRRIRQWRCICDCGNECIIKTHTFTDKNIFHSCGCMSKLDLRDNRFPIIKRVYDGYIRGAKRRGYSFHLSLDFFSNLVQAPCYYCGRKPFKVSHRATGYKNGDDLKLNGIDRRNNSIGYTEGNCVSACWDCNKLKRAFSEDKFLEIIKRIYEHRLT